MKVIRYKYKNKAIEATWSEKNEKIVAAEADDGIYTIEDDGLPEEADGETIVNRVDNLETKTDDLTEALDMILNEVTE